MSNPASTDSSTAEIAPSQSPRTLSITRPHTDRVFHRILTLLIPWKFLILLSIVMLIVAGLCEMFPAFIWKYVTDDIALKNPSTPWVHHLVSFAGRITDPYTLVLSAVLWLIGVYCFGELLATLENNLLSRITQKFITRLRNQIHRKLQTQSLSYLQRQRTGDLMSRAMSDVEELQSFITNGIDVILGEGIIWIITVCIVMYYDWRVASLSLAPLLCVFIMLRVFNARIKPIYTASRERLGDVSNRLQENLSGITVIRIFGREEQEAQRFENATDAHYRQQVKSINTRSLYFPFARSVGFLSNVFMIGMGGYLLLAEHGKPGGFTLGTLIMFRAYWWRLFGPVQTLARVNDMVQRAIASGRRVFEVLDAPDELSDRPDAKTLTSCKGDLALHDLSFSYAPGSPLVFNKINLHIPAGKTVALCGPSGAGKSTVLNLLLRFYDPIQGQVTIDNHDIKTLTRQSLRNQFALVQQESFLFNESILDNIRYGHPQATMEQVIAAARAANAHAFINAMPDNYNTLVGERGVRLSGGQKQRISIARAFLANAHILLLDEPTSSVEPDSEQAIISALRRLMANRTTVVTSHRPSLIAQADHVYVIQDGNVAQQGTVDQLMQTSPWFARFMRSGDAPTNDPQA